MRAAAPAAMQLEKFRASEIILSNKPTDRKAKLKNFSFF